MPTQQRTPAADAYEIHDKYWADSGGDIRVPVDPFEIAESMGIRVFSAVLGRNRSGYLDLKAVGGPTIFVNDSHGVARQRFTVAHELGHFVDADNRNLPHTFDTFDRDERSASGTDQTEIYANRFAAALLMPKKLVLKLRDEGMDSYELSHRFGVSQTSMDWRLRNLGYNAE